jgi:excisionase family DNA binding protein
MSDRLLITIREAAELLGLSESTVYRLAREDRIPVVRIGASVRINRRHLETWIESHTEAA